MAVFVHRGSNKHRDESCCQCSVQSVLKINLWCVIVGFGDFKRAMALQLGALSTTHCMFPPNIFESFRKKAAKSGVKAEHPFWSVNIVSCNNLNPLYL
jgi:hypothetical protein